MGPRVHLYSKGRADTSCSFYVSSTVISSPHTFSPPTQTYTPPLPAPDDSGPLPSPLLPFQLHTTAALAGICDTICEYQPSPPTLDIHCSPNLTHHHRISQSRTATFLYKKEDTKSQKIARTRVILIFLRLGDIFPYYATWSGRDVREYIVPPASTERHSHSRRLYIFQSHSGKVVHRPSPFPLLFSLRWRYSHSDCLSKFQPTSGVPHIISVVNVRLFVVLDVPRTEYIIVFTRG